jgi:Tfp pilus assembly protein PilN
MINLLPPDIKTGYIYARRNVGLRRWVVIFALAFIGLGAITTYGLLSLKQSSVHYNKHIAHNQSVIQKEHFNETQDKIKDISGSFKLVVKVLGQEVLFSQLLKQIAATIPARANLTSLNIAQTQGAIDLSAIAPDYNTATQVQVNLADPHNKIFSRADIVSINCGSTTALVPGFPCSVNIRALFANNNPFLFINGKAAKP